MIPFEGLAFLFRRGPVSRGIVRLDINEAALLYSYVKKCSGDVLEIGRMFGGSAILMAAALDEGQVAHTIDIEDRAESMENIGAFHGKEKIDVHVGDSVMIAENWQTKLSLVFVDGGHAFTACENDAKYWGPFVEPNGYMIFHDIRGSGAYLKLEPVITTLVESKEWIEVDAIGSMVVLQKVDRSKV